MERKKYPRTMNLPWSQSNSSDDVWWGDAHQFNGREVVMTEKLDGECTTVYPDGHIHARSLDSKHHPSRSWMKSLAANFAYKIPEGLRVCGENVYAFHSILYKELTSYFFVFGIYEGDKCLAWDDVEFLCQELGLVTTPVIYRGVWNEKLVREKWPEDGESGNGTFPTFALKPGSKYDHVFTDEDFVPCEAEGYVVRVVEEFHYDTFKSNCAKFVRKNHVQTDQNWMTAPTYPNKLKEDV